MNKQICTWNVLCTCLIASNDPQMSNEKRSPTCFVPCSSAVMSITITISELRPQMVWLASLPSPSNSSTSNLWTATLNWLLFQFQWLNSYLNRSMRVQAFLKNDAVSHKTMVDMVINFRNKTWAPCAITFGFRTHSSHGISICRDDKGPHSTLIIWPH